MTATKKKALITGAEGFVGFHLAKGLLAHGYDVYGTVLDPTHFVPPFSDVHYVKANICDYTSFSELINSVKPDVIFHLAAISSVAFSWKNPQQTIEVNAIGTTNLLEIVRQLSPSTKIVLIGSSEEYGSIDYTKPVQETTGLKPKNVYAITKAFQEQMGLLYAQAYGLNVSITRSFNHFGPHQGPGFVVSDFCRQIVAAEKNPASNTIHVGNLAAQRDFIFVGDVIKAYLLIAEKGKAGEVYNVGSGHARSIQEILNCLLSFSTVRPSIAVDKSLFRPIDVPFVEADISKLKGLGYHPGSSFEDSLKETLESYRSL